MPWIGVKDRLPPTGEVVTVYCPGQPKHESIFQAELRKDGVWEIHIDGAVLRGVTHWSPLLAPPISETIPPVGFMPGDGT